MKRIFFAKLIVLALLATVGCNSEGGSGQRSNSGSQFVGAWQDPEADCSPCGRWVFTETKEGGLWAEYYKHGGGGAKVDYAANYDAASKMVNIESGNGLKAAIVNGNLKIRSVTYQKVTAEKQALGQ